MVGQLFTNKMEILVNIFYRMHSHRLFHVSYFISFKNTVNKKIEFLQNLTTQQNRFVSRTNIVLKFEKKTLISNLFN